MFRIPMRYKKKQYPPTFNKPPTSFNEPYANQVQGKPKQGSNLVEGNIYRKNAVQNSSNYSYRHEKEQVEGVSAPVQPRPATSLSSQNKFSLAVPSQQSAYANANSGYNYHVDQKYSQDSSNHRSSDLNAKSGQCADIKLAPWAGAMGSVVHGENKEEINHHSNAPYYAAGDSGYKEIVPPLAENKASYGSLGSVQKT